MGAMEIILLVAGAVIFIISFCIPVKQEKLKEETRNLAAAEVRNLVSAELENVRSRLSELSEDEMQQQIEKSGRSMERISNEKIMAVSEYSDTVLEEIHKNHEEVVFLYDMLKGKRESLSDAYSKADQNIQELLQQVKDAEITVREGLAELPGKKKEQGEHRKKAVSHAGTKQEGQAVKETAPKDGTGTGEESTIKEIRAEIAEPAEMAAFQPFVPEKVEVVPKRAPEKRDVKEPKGESGEKAAERMPEEASEDGNTGAVNSNERILKLHRAGKSNMSIARELGLGVGEVKLVIDLYEGIR